MTHSKHLSDEYDPDEELRGNLDEPEGELDFERKPRKRKLAKQEQDELVRNMEQPSVNWYEDNAGE